MKLVENIQNYYWGQIIFWNFRKIVVNTFHGMKVLFYSGSPWLKNLNLNKNPLIMISNERPIAWINNKQVEGICHYYSEYLYERYCITNNLSYKKNYKINNCIFDFFINDKIIEIKTLFAYLKNKYIFLTCMGRIENRYMVEKEVSYPRIEKQLKQLSSEKNSQIVFISQCGKLLDIEIHSKAKNLKLLFDKINKKLLVFKFIFNKVYFMYEKNF